MGGPTPPFDDDLITVITQLVRPLLLPGEQLADVLAGVNFLGAERAVVHGRVPVSLAAFFVLLLLALCPWPARQSPDLQARLGQVRVQLFAAASQNLDPDQLRAAVPKATLLLPIEAIYVLHPQSVIEDFLRV